MPISEELLGRIIENDSTLTSLDLGYKQIEDEEVQVLANALENNTNLTILDLGNNEIGSEGAQAIANTLHNNKTLISIDLSNNQIGDEGVQALASALENNTTLTILNLWDNLIGPAGAQALANALHNNTTLIILHLGINQIGDEGVQALASAIENNVALTSLNLRHNQIGDEGVQALANALHNNPTLISLDLGDSLELEGLSALDTINAITERNKNIIPEISQVITRIIRHGSEEKPSIPQIRFISDNSPPRNCVKILENLVKNKNDISIPDFLKKIRDMKGLMGAMILYTAIKAQESNLPQNKLSLPEDELKLVKDVLTEMNLANWFKAKGVTKEGVKNGLGDKSRKIQLNANTENLILEYLKRDDIKKIPQTTVNTSRKLTVNLVNDSACNQKECCTID